jgi:hypothetical protein
VPSPRARRHPFEEGLGLLPSLLSATAPILARALDLEPTRRYQTAAALAADLRRHLADEPLRGVRERGLAERWRKWRRRRPHTITWRWCVTPGATVPGR